MRSRMLTVGLMVAGVWSASTLTAWADDPKSAAEAPPPAAATYACPMHPQIQATFPGSCPICRMALKAKGPTTAAEPAPMNHADHAHQGMSMGSMNMGGMDMGAMSCPQCTMGMQGMSMKGAPAATATPSKVTPAVYRSSGGRRCGC